MIAPCLITQPVRYPHGGFGSIWSQAYLLRQLPKFDSSFDIGEKPICQAILKENGAEEKAVFEEGMHLLDLLEAYTTKDPFVNYKNWTVGYCMHSDIVWGCFMNLLTR